MCVCVCVSICVCVCVCVFVFVRPLVLQTWAAELIGIRSVVQPRLVLGLQRAMEPGFCVADKGCVTHRNPLRRPTLAVVGAAMGRGTHWNLLRCQASATGRLPSFFWELVLHTLAAELVGICCVVQPWNSEFVLHTMAVELVGIRCVVQPWRACNRPRNSFESTASSNHGLSSCHLFLGFVLHADMGRGTRWNLLRHPTLAGVPAKGNTTRSLSCRPGPWNLLESVASSNLGSCRARKGLQNSLESTVSSNLGWCSSCKRQGTHCKRLYLCFVITITPQLHGRLERSRVT